MVNDSALYVSLKLDVGVCHRVYKGVKIIMRIKEN